MVGWPSQVLSCRVVRMMTEVRGLVGRRESDLNDFLHVDDETLVASQTS